MGHWEIKREVYPQILMALGDDLNIIAQHGVDKEAVLEIRRELFRASGHLHALFEKYGGFARSTVKIGHHKHIFGGEKIGIDSEERKLTEEVRGEGVFDKAA